MGSAGLWQWALEVTYNGCTSRDEIQVRSSSMLIPNVIMPDDGDQLNQFFVLKGLNPRPWALTLFNRWGKQIYTTRSYDNGWNATGQPAGVYYYLPQNAATGQKYQGWKSAAADQLLRVARSNSSE